MRTVHGGEPVTCDTEKIGLNAWFTAEESPESEELPRTDEPQGGANEDVEQHRVAVTVNQCSGSC